MANLLFIKDILQRQRIYFTKMYFITLSASNEINNQINCCFLLLQPPKIRILGIKKSVQETEL